MTATRRPPVSDAELAVIAEALREALAAELLSPGSQSTARELLGRVDAKLPAALDQHPAGARTGRLLAGDEILRLLLAHEDRHGSGALSNEQIAGQLSWKPAGTSVRELLEELRRAGWPTARGSGPERRFELTRKGRGRARELAHAGSAPDSEARVSKPDELLDLIYADSTPCAITFSGERIPGVWHRPTVQAAARLSSGTLTPVGERRARERWHASRPRGAFGGPARLARPYRRAGSIVARAQDRACPNCAAPQLADPATHEALGGAHRPRRGRLQLPAVRRALDDLPRAHQPRWSV